MRNLLPTVGVGVALFFFSSLVAASSWHKLPFTGESPPHGRDFHSTVVDLQNQVFAFGGNTGINGWALWNDLHVFDIATSHWNKLEPSGSPPTRRFRHSAIYDPIRDDMIVFGGSTIEGLNPPVFLNDLSYYNIGKNTWQTNVASTGTPPAPRSFHCGVNANGVMVIYGGGDASGIFNDIHYYHLAEQRWEKPTVGGNGPPEGRSHASLVYNAKANEVILFGGLRWHGSEGYVNTLHRFNLDTRTWSTPTVSGTLPSARVGHAAVLLQKKMVIFGGYDQRGKFLDTMSQFNIETNTWESITSENPPSPRYSLCPIVPRGSDSSFLIFDGYADTLALRTTFFDEVWRWDA